MPETIEVKDTSLQIVKSQPAGLQRQQETFAPRNLAEAVKFAELIANSGMVPKDYVGKPAAIVVAIQMGMEVGLQPMQALQNIAVINGRPAIWGDGALALVKTHPEFEWIKEDDIETIKKNGRATCVIKRRNQPEVKMTFSLEDAKNAGLAGKDIWAKYTSRMLQMRARGFAIRDAFPDALKGIITAEEAMDIPPDTVIQGAPLVEAAPDPLDAFISPEEAKELWDLAKKNGHVIKVEQGFNVDAYKKALQDIGHCDSSNKMQRRYHDAFKQWVSVPAQQAQAENPDAEPPEQGQ